MSLTIDIASHQVIDLPDDRYVFLNELPGSLLLLQNTRTNASLSLTEQQFLTLLADGEARLINPPGRGAPKGCDPEIFSPIVPAGTSETKLREAEVIQKYIMLADKAGEPAVGRGEKFWQGFVAANCRQAIGKGADPGVTPSQVLRSWKKVKGNGNRSLSVFISQRGTVPRQRQDPDEESAYSVAVNFFYAKRGHTRRQSKAVLGAVLKKINIERAKRGVEPLTLPQGHTTLRTKILAARNKEAVARKTTRREADFEFNGTNAALKSDIPFEYIALDHTVVDVFIVDDDTGMPLGRPVLGIAIDVATRCIAGIHIGWEPPSISTLLTLLKKIIQPKYYIRDLLPDVFDGIDTFGKPYNLIVDRGLENLSDGLEHSCSQLGIDIRWAPRKNGQAKTWVERLFDSINVGLIHPLEGSVPHGPTLMRKLQLDPQKTAQLTLGDFHRLLHRYWINYENQTHGGIDDIPARRLQRLLKIHKRPILADITDLEALIGDTATCRLRTDGIAFRGLQFQNRNATTEIRSALVGEQRKSKKNSKSSVEVLVKFNPDDASVIHVPFMRKDRWIYIPFYNTEITFIASLSFSMEKKIRLFARQNNIAYETEAHRIDARLALITDMELRSQLRGAGARKIDRRLQAQKDRLIGDFDVQDDELSQDALSKVVEAPSPHLPDTDVRGRGIRPGGKKSIKTRAHNDKIRKQLRDHLSPHPKETTVSAAGYQQPLGISFTKGMAKK